MNLWINPPIHGKPSCKKSPSFTGKIPPQKVISTVQAQNDSGTSSEKLVLLPTKINSFTQAEAFRNSFRQNPLLKNFKGTSLVDVL